MSATATPVGLVCSAPGCGLSAEPKVNSGSALGLCPAHYQRERRVRKANGEPVLRRVRKWAPTRETPDEETRALQACCFSLERIPSAARIRVLEYLVHRFRSAVEVSP